MVDNEERYVRIEKCKDDVGDESLGKIKQKVWIVVILDAPECALRVALNTDVGSCVSFGNDLHSGSSLGPFGKQILKEIHDTSESLDHVNITSEEFRSFVQGIYEVTKNQEADRHELKQRST